MTVLFHVDMRTQSQKHLMLTFNFVMTLNIMLKSNFSAAMLVGYSLNLELAHLNKIQPLIMVKKNLSHVEIQML